MKNYLQCKQDTFPPEFLIFLFGKIQNTRKIYIHTVYFLTGRLNLHIIWCIMGKVRDVTYGQADRKRFL